MARVIQITDDDIKRLRAEIALEKFRQYEIAAADGKQRQLIHDIHRSFHYYLEVWLGEISR